MSRPGYLGIPLTIGPTFEGQADAYAALLDAIDNDQVGILAISGGGPPALQFVLNHPERILGMVMLSTNLDVNGAKMRKRPFKLLLMTHCHQRG